MFTQQSQRESNTKRAKCLLIIAKKIKHRKRQMLLNNRREDEIGSARDINVTIAEIIKLTVCLTPK